MEACIILIDILFIILTLSLVILRKNDNTRDNCIIIVKAIGAYHVDLIDRNEFYKSQVEYEDMRSYEATLFRIWDWGYENILPKDKFEIIKPYIKEEQK